jgi:hypothetical protein
MRRVKFALVLVLFVTGILGITPRLVWAATTQPIIDSTNEDIDFIPCVPVNSSTPIPKCEQKTIQTLPYVAPPACTGTPNVKSASCTVDEYVYVKGDPFIPGLTSSVYGMGNGLVVQNFNSEFKHLLYKVDGNTIKLLQDTTWANAQKCDETGKPAMQKIVTGSSPGGNMLGTTMQCGAIYPQGGENVAYTYDPSEEENLKKNPTYTSSLITNQCTNKNEGPLYVDDKTGKQIIFQGQAVCGTFGGNIMVVWNNGGKGAGEVYIYCEGKGLCGFYESINWNHPETQPANWHADTDLCANFREDICTPPVYKEGDFNKVANLTFGQQLEVSVARLLQAIGVPIQPLTPKTEQSIDVQKEYTTFDGLMNALHPEDITIDPKGSLATDKRMNGATQKQPTTLQSNLYTEIQKDPYTSKTNIVYQNQLYKPFISLNWMLKSTLIPDQGQEANGIGSDGKPVMNLNIPQERMKPNTKIPIQSFEGQTIPVTEYANTGLNKYQNEKGQTGGAIQALAHLLGNVQGITTDGQTNDTARPIMPPKKVDVAAPIQMPSQNVISNLPTLNEYGQILSSGFLTADISSRIQKNQNGVVKGTFTSPLGSSIDVEQQAKGYATTKHMYDCQIAGTFPADRQEAAGVACKDLLAAPLEDQIATADGTPRDLLTTVTPIDIQNTSCKVTDMNTVMNARPGGKESLASLFGRWYFPRQGAGVQGAKNLQLAFVNELQNIVASRGYNPAFFLAMWMEESAASGINFSESWGMGCRGDSFNKGKYDQTAITLNIGESTDPAKVAAHVKEQAKCLANTVDAAVRNSSPGKDLYSRFLRVWAGGEYTKPFPTDLATSISMWYNLLVGSCGVLK